MTHFDLIIVGAGPAGSNAAAVALDAGLRVAQIDAAAFPRVKPCAGGMTLKAADSLRYPIDPSVSQSFTEIEFNLWGRRRNRFAHPLVVLRTVCRPEFDNRLVQTNLLRRNFTFMDRQRVLGVEYDGHFTVKTSAGSLTGTQLVGADGAYSLVNRIFQIAAPRALATAVEINIPRSGQEELSNDVPCFDYGAVPQGYGWVFPKQRSLVRGLVHAVATRAEHPRLPDPVPARERIGVRRSAPRGHGGVQNSGWRVSLTNACLPGVCDGRRRRVRRRADR